MKTIYLVAILLLMIGCATTPPKSWPPYQINVIDDKFDGFTINRMDGNWIGHFEYFPPRHGVQLNPQKYQPGNGKAIFSLVVEYIGSDWLFIEEGESLIILVDGERMAFSGDGSWDHRDVIYSSIKEMAWYDLDYKDLVKIANATEVELKLSGSQYYTTERFTETNFRNFRLFVEQFKP